MKADGVNVSSEGISRFSWIVDGSEQGSTAAWDREIARTRSFSVLPSAGSLVPGWLLAVPRRQMLNLGQATSDELTELATLVQSLAAVTSKFGGQVFCFEHGANHVGSRTGCGVDQAHLHIVPLPFDLLDAIAAADPNLQWREYGPELFTLSYLPVDGEYFAAWRVDNGRAMIASVHRPTSQWIRRVIARNLGLEEEWDYRTHPQNQNVHQTLSLLEAGLPLLDKRQTANHIG